jgi:hypothetical protein
MARKGIRGGKGGLGYGDVARKDSPELQQQVLERSGLTGVKGHGKGGSGSGESDQTKKERELYVATRQEILAEEHQASRPKANIHEQEKMTVDEKVLAKAKSIKSEHADELYLCEQEFRAYLVNRNITLPQQTTELIAQWLGDETNDTLEKYLATYLS